MLPLVNIIYFESKKGGAKEESDKLTFFVLLCLFLFWFCRVDDSFRENTNKTTVHIFFPKHYFKFNLQFSNYLVNHKHEKLQNCP